MLCKNRLDASASSGVSTSHHISCSISGSFRFVLRPREAVRVLAALGLTGAILSLPANALISPTSPVGATPGTFAVSPSGAATYTIPIVVPPGVNGLQLNLALVYNSQGGNGLLGVGWGLSGLSVVHRCGATIELDGFKGGVNYDANDRFCLDGERLMRVGTSAEYRTEKESLQKIQAADTTVNPAWFTVTTPDGTVRQYGMTAAHSKMLPPPALTAARLMTTLKKKVTDLFFDFPPSKLTEKTNTGSHSMPRLGRIVLPHYPHHVVQRGHNRQVIFAESQDYERYLKTLQEFKAEYGVEVYAYCLMTNHVHLLLAPSEPDAIGKLMKRLAGRQTRYHNRLEGRSGTLGKGDTNRV